jgi:endoglucanase
MHSTMEPNARVFFEKILATPSPSGYEGPLQAVVREYVASFADEVSTDVHGNVLAVRNPRGSRRLMLAGHCDQIGLIVKYIDNDGYVYAQAIGGWDIQMLVGQRMTIWGSGGPVNGVIGRKPIHLLTEEERKQVPKLKDLWIDIGASTRDEVEKLVQIGDPVTLELVYQSLRNDRAASPAMDDKCGLWVVMEALRRIDAEKLDWAVYAVSTVQEEIGLRGSRTSAFGVDPHVGVAVDVTHATDCPTIEKKEEGEVSLGKGPVIHRGPNMNPRVSQRLIELAQKNHIPHQISACGKATGTDANSIQINRAGVAAGLISIPNRYMHSPVETISTVDIDDAANLLARLAEDLVADDDFTP